MYCVANRKNVKKAIASGDLPLAQGKSAGELLRLIDEGPQWGSSLDSYAIVAFLRKLDSFFDWSFGVDGIGDTYAPTLLWEKGKLRIGCWGDCVESAC